ncbi:MAG: hypothetical protein AAF039_07400 [Bacteroidota bacterium]
MGSASQPMLVVKYNRALLKKRNIKELKDLIRETSGKTALAFKEITPEEMAVVKEKIRLQHKQHVQQEIKLYVISGIVTLLLLFGLYVFLKD